MNELSLQTLPLRDSQPIDTSGTVGTTVTDTITVIERAAARCGKQAINLTPEDLDTAKTNLFFILSKLTTRGLNLWAVEQFYMPIEPGKPRYELPTATEGIVNLMYRTVQRLAGQISNPVNSASAAITFTDTQKVALMGFKLSAERTGRYIMEYTADGTNWLTIEDFHTLTLSAGWHWYMLEVAVNCKGIRIRDYDDNALVVPDILAASSANDLPMTKFNRDDYTGMNNKFLAGSPNSYFFEKKIESAVSFWPVPDDETAHFVVWRHRAIQDVGSLSGKLEVPDRWFDTIVWMLAKNLAFELKDVSPDRLQLCITQAAEAENYSELGENDSGPMRMQPNISGYTA